MTLKPTRILVAVDLSPHSDRALDRAVALAEQAGATLTAVHVVDTVPTSGSYDDLAEDARNRLNRHIGARIRTGGLVETEIRLGTAAEEIMAAADAADADLIVLGTHQPVGADLFRHPTIARVLREGGRAVLLVRDRPLGAYGKVIVAVDESDCSRRALRLAMSSFPEADITVVRAYDVPFGGFVTGADADRTAMKAHKQKLERVVADEVENFATRAGGAAPAVTPLVCRGEVREVVDGLVRRLKPDLLVIGTHGRGGIKRTLLGSVAEDLLRRPPCDVLAVR